MSQKVVSLIDYKKQKYLLMPKQKLFYLPKEELLEQLISYYEAVKKDPFSVPVALWGEDLMDVISTRALTRELQDLAETHKTQGYEATFKFD